MVGSGCDICGRALHSLSLRKNVSGGLFSSFFLLSFLSSQWLAFSRFDFFHHGRTTRQMGGGAFGDHYSTNLPVNV